MSWERRKATHRFEPDYNPPKRDHRHLVATLSIVRAVDVDSPHARTFVLVQLHTTESTVGGGPAIGSC